MVSKISTFVRDLAFEPTINISSIADTSREDRISFGPNILVVTGYRYQGRELEEICRRRLTTLSAR